MGGDTRICSGRAMDWGELAPSWPQAEESAKIKLL